MWEKQMFWVKKVKGLSNGKEETLLDTDNSMVITRGKQGWGRSEDIQGDKWGWKETGLGAVNTQYSVQMVCYRIVQLTPL